MQAILTQRIQRAHRKRVAESTLYKYERAYTIYDGWLAGRGLDARAITPLVFEDFMDDMLARYKPSTVRIYLTMIRSAYSYDRQVSPQTACPDPTITAVIPVEDETRPRVFSVRELQAMRDACTCHEDRMVVYLFAYTGVRLTEACYIKWTDIYFDRGMIDVLGKFGKRRYVPLHPELRRHLNMIPEAAREDYVLIRKPHGRSVSNWPMSGHALFRRVEGIIAAGAESHATTHAFRKTVATTLLREGARFGVRETTIEKIMGWAPSSVAARHYWDVPDEDMHAAINLLYPGGL